MIPESCGLGSLVLFELMRFSLLLRKFVNNI